MRYTGTILIVDDEQTGRDILEALLDGRGYNLAFASSGEEALAKAAELTPDLILLDVMMPDLSGFEVCRRLRADPLLAEIPIIMVTALNDRTSRLQGIEAGADDFVIKPFDQIELRARVQTITRLNNYRQRLRESEKMVSLGRLIAGAAHELNNPIGFIYSNVSHLRSYVDDVKRVLKEYDDMCASLPQLADRVSSIEKLKDQIDFDYILKDLDCLVDDIYEGARRTKEIVENLRTVSPSNEEKIREGDIIDDIEKSLILLIHYHKDRIKIHRDYSDLPRVRSRSGQISQVFMNLIANACQAIEGEGDIWITTRRENDMVVISIRDNGIGIPEDHIGKIFEPFFTTKDVGEGAGLGLSISYGIIQRHKGEILVDSQLGSGTTFTIRIPVDFENYSSAKGEGGVL